MILQESRIPKEIFKEKLVYNKETGVFTWIGKARNSGRVAGQVVKRGRQSYILLGIGYKSKVYKVAAHRVAWMFTTGDWPSGEIDHLDGNGLNNSINNLRDVSRSENNKNRRLQSNNTTGIHGVSFRPKYNSWRVYSFAEKKQTHLGVYFDFFEACCVRKRYELENGFTARHGIKIDTEVIK